MKNIVLILTFILQSILVFGQNKKDFNLLETDSSWNQEIFHFPISFAPEIKFEGFEDARFPKNWSKKDSSEFWSYVFVWSIKNPVEITTEILKNNIEKYFNGLMSYQNSEALFSKKEINSNFTKYVGKLKTFDNLVSKTNMTLNATVEHSYCKKSKTTYILFRFSPQEFRVNIWNKLNSIKLRKNFCDF